MFTMAVSGTGKEYYVGKVTRQIPTALEITGDDYAEDHITVVERRMQLKLSPDIQEKCKQVSPGMVIIASAVRSKLPMLGYTDEIAVQNEVISMKSQDGYDKLLIIGKISNIRWSINKKRLEVSFLNLKKTDGRYLGLCKNYQGKDWYWTSVNYFPSVKDKDDLYTAERVEKELKKGDIVAMTVNIKVNDSRGHYYTNYNGAKYTVIKRFKSESA